MYLLAPDTVPAAIKQLELSMIDMSNFALRRFLSIGIPYKQAVRGKIWRLCRMVVVNTFKGETGTRTGG